MKVLTSYKVPPRLIHIFVADKIEAEVYKKELEPKSYGKIVIGKPGIKEIRNFMANYFPQGKRIVYLDDDISRLWRCVSKGDPKNKKDNKLIELESFDKFVKDAFKMSVKTGYRNWGVYPTDNPYFMKPTMRDGSHVSTDLKFLIGFFTGVINNHKTEVRTISDKEDYERSIKYYLADGGILRFNNISCNTRCYKEPGGIQTDRKKENSRVNAGILIKNYPDLVSVNTGRKSGFVEIRLRDKRTTTANKQSNKQSKKNLSKNQKGGSDGMSSSASSSALSSAPSSALPPASGSKSMKQSFKKNHKKRSSKRSSPKQTK